MRRVVFGFVLGLAAVAVSGRAYVQWTSVRTTSVADWLPTKNCESPGHGWDANTHNGYYGGLQFDAGTWKAHGGLVYASRADLASPSTQVLVASRLRYDGWPNCPNPPRYR